MVDRMRTIKSHKQKGLTLISFILVLALALFVSFLTMKIAPIYMEYYSVVSIMNGIADEQGSARLTPYEIRLKVSTNLNLNYSTNVKSKHFKLTNNNGASLRVAYEVRESVIGNLDVVAKFDKSVRLSN